VAHYEIAPEAVDAEIARFDRGMQTAQEGLQALKAHIPPDAPKEFEAFLALHRMILNDSALAVVPREMIRSRRANAEWALVQQMDRLVERFDEIDDPYLRERKADVEHAVERVLKALMGGQKIAEPAVSEEQKLIVVAHDLSPADMILFKRHRFGGFVTDVGGVTSHTAIVARSLGIPAGRAGDEGPPGGAANAGCGRRQGDERRRRRAHHAEPGDGIARDPLLPGRAADVPHPAARHPARFALRHGEDPAADGGARA